MKISEELSTSLININLQGETKGIVFDEMVKLFLDNDMLNDHDTAIEALFERENMMTTGIAKWLGLPHGKLAEISERMIAIGISKKGIEYDSLDGEPVYVIIMVFSEEGNPGPHIEALAEISRLLCIPGFTMKMRECKTAADVLQIIKEEE